MLLTPTLTLPDNFLTTYNEVLLRGLCSGKGNPQSQMCIEAAICYSLGLPHDDDPKCVSEAVRQYKIYLNDSNWSSPEARAKGLYKVGLAQLGSLGVVDDREFCRRMTQQTIKQLIPKLFREIFTDAACLDAALECEQTGSKLAAMKAGDCAGKVFNIYAAAAADAAAFAPAADAAAYVADFASKATQSDTYLNFSIEIALQILKDLNSPGCRLLEIIQQDIFIPRR